MKGKICIWGGVLLTLLSFSLIFFGCSNSSGGGEEGGGNSTGLILSQNSASVLPGKNFKLFAVLNGEVCNDLYWTVNDISIASISNSTSSSGVTEADIVGTWIGMNNSSKYIFKSDKTGNFSYPNVGSAEFTWKMDTIITSKVVLDITSATGALSNLSGGPQEGMVADDGKTMSGSVGSLTKTGSAMIESGICIVSGNSAGTVKITAQTKDYRYSATCSVKVTDVGIAATGLALDKTSAEVESGKKIFLRPKFTPANATDQSVTWTSSDTSIATVDQYGIVTGVATRSSIVTITAKSSTGYTASCNVKVKGGILDSTSVEQVLGSGWQYSNSITIPRYITEINDIGSFQSLNPSLQEIKVESGNENFVAVGGVLFNKDKTKLIWYPRSKSGRNYTIPSTVNTIGENAFSFCELLTSITIPNNITTIEGCAFGTAQSLKTVIIPGSVKSIGGNAFSNCKNLTSVTINEGVTSIGDSAFFYCESLTNITIPSSVTSIGYGAFNYCIKLERVTIKASTPPSCGSNAFDSNAPWRMIYVPESALNAYTTNNGDWSKYASDIVGSQEN